MHDFIYTEVPDNLNIIIISGDKYKFCARCGIKIIIGRGYNIFYSIENRKFIWANENTIPTCDEVIIKSIIE